MKPDHSINMDRGTLSGLLNYSAMNRDAIYRRSAAFAQRRAERAVNADDREEWRRIAQGWLALLRKRPMSDRSFTIWSDV